MPRAEGKHHHHVLIEPDEDRWAWRRRIRQNPHQLRVYRVGVGVLGLLLICLGLVTGPLPGPGGIPLVLLGLAIWSSEFEWAYKLRQRFKAEVRKFRGWSTGKKVAFWVVFFAACGCLGYSYLLMLGVPFWMPDVGASLLDHLPGVEAPADSSRIPHEDAPACWNDGMRADAYPFFDADFLAFAHRGGAHYPSNLHRENSRHAFTEAVALGYRYLETDVHLTADGVLIAFHDNKLDRVTDATGRIADLPYEVVARARIGGHDPIPTLSELLEAFPDARFNIDAKSDGAVDVLARTIADHDAYERVCVSSFGLRRLHELRRLLGPRTASAASFGSASPLNRFAPWLTAALDSPAPVLQIPVDQRIFGLATCGSSPTGCCARRTPTASRSTSGPSTTGPRSSS